MDTSDPNITFDNNGYCNHCSAALKMLERQKSIKDPVLLDNLINKIKNDGVNKKYDCVIGVSGGVDSTYVAYLVKEKGLRPLAVHLDNGWNSELAVKNIEKTLKKLDIDLYTHVLDWNEFKNLQLAFLKASTPDSEVPTDHAIFSVLYNVCRKFGIKYMISGNSISTESILPKSWSQGINDWKYIKSINKMFGKIKLSTYPHNSLLKEVDNRLIRKINRVRILDYIDYKKEDAEKILKEVLGWTPYGNKHYESIYTRFFQGYILPEKFGFDKRKAHLSSLIITNQLERDEALRLLEEEIYDPNLLREDLVFFKSKLSLSDQEFDDIMSMKPMRFEDYPNYENTFLLSNILNSYYNRKERK
jgi:N-acetyl sugar amidotransferase